MLNDILAAWRIPVVIFYFIILLAPSWGHFLLTHFPIKYALMEGGGVLVYKDKSQHDLIEKNYVDEIKILIKTLGIQKLVKFTDYVSHSEKLKLMQSAEVFVLTSLTDVHPRAVQEALVMKTPVIISRECDCPGVEEFEAGKIVLLDSDKVHEALVDLLTNPETLDKYSKNSIKLVQEKYLLENQMKKIIDMYNNVVSNHEYD